MACTSKAAGGPLRVREAVEQLRDSKMGPERIEDRPCSTAKLLGGGYSPASVSLRSTGKRLRRERGAGVLLNLVEEYS